MWDAMHLGNLNIKVDIFWENYEYMRVWEGESKSVNQRIGAVYNAELTALVICEAKLPSHANSTFSVMPWLGIFFFLLLN